MRVWRIRAGRRGGIVAEEFWTGGFVALSWQELGHSIEGMDRQDIRAELESMFGRSAAGIAAGQLHRFLEEVGRGHLVLTPTVETRELLVGRVVGDYRYEATRLSDGSVWGHRRDVEWLDRESVDILPSDIKALIDTPPTLREVRSVDRLLRVLGADANPSI